MRERHRKYDRSLAGRYRAGKKSAKKRNIKFTITLDEYVSIVGNAICIYCNGPLPETGFSLDRMNNKRGYELDNVVPCCATCNSIKGSFLSYTEMIIISVTLKAFRAVK